VGVITKAPINEEKPVQQICSAKETDYKNKQAFIIDPYPSQQVKDLCIQLNAKLIEKHLEDILISDLV
jgi:hypothetical protein